MRTADGAAKTREDAIQAALRELDLELSDIEKIEIVDEGSKGLFGFGARDVRVRLHAEDLPEERPRRGGRPKRNDRGPRREGRGREGKVSRDDGGQKGDRPARKERQGRGKDGQDSPRKNDGGGRKEGRPDRKDRPGPRKERQARGSGSGNGREDRKPAEQAQSAKEDSTASESGSGGGRGNRSRQRDDKRPQKPRAPYKVDVSKEAKEERSESLDSGSASTRGRSDRQDRGPRSERAARPRRQPRRERPERKRERPPMDPEAAATMGIAAAALLQEVIAKMGMESTVTSEVGAEGDILLNVESEDSAILIGRKGRNLSAMQFLLNRMIGHSEEGEIFDRIILDVEGYLARRRTSLEEMAVGLAQKAKDTGRSMRVKPLNPQERRIIHLTLENDDEIRTFSLGSSLHRRVVIVPNNAEDNGEGDNWDDAEDADFDVEETESLPSEQDDS